MKNNRKRFIDMLNENETAVFFSGTAPRKIGDEYYPFSPDRNFYYLTGIDEPGLILALSKTKGAEEEILFISPPDTEEEKWTGAVLSETEAANISGIEHIYFSDRFGDFIDGAVRSGDIKTLCYDSESNDARRIKEYGDIPVRDIFPLLGDLRETKSETEIKNIEKAIDITRDGIYSMMKNVRPGMYEYQLESYFDFELKYRGVREFAFPSIIASGKNAATLHYTKNNCVIKDQSLILCDVGAAYKHYSADITRTFPSGGRFTKRQELFYNIVLEGNYIIRDYIRPGLEFGALNKKLMEYYYKELSRVGLVSSYDDIKKYYWHNVSHRLGLETHDIGAKRDGIIKEGAVLTVEPGLYIEEEGIGIRTEDDVVVTAFGCRTLSEDVIRSVSDIENFMK